MGVYNATKAAVVSLSETLYQDLALITEQVHAHLLCPFFVPTASTAANATVRPRCRMPPRPRAASSSPVP